MRPGTSGVSRRKLRQLRKWTKLSGLSETSSTECSRCSPITRHRSGQRPIPAIRFRLWLSEKERTKAWPIRKRRAVPGDSGQETQPSSWSFSSHKTAWHQTPASSWISGGNFHHLPPDITIFFLHSCITSVSRSMDHRHNLIVLNLFKDSHGFGRNQNFSSISLWCIRKEQVSSGLFRPQ